MYILNYWEPADKVRKDGPAEIGLTAAVLNQLHLSPIAGILFWNYAFLYVLLIEFYSFHLKLHIEI